MNTVTLTADGRLLAGGKDEATQPLAVLNHGLALAPDATLRSYFLMLGRYGDLQRLGEFFAVLMDEYKKCPESGCTIDTLSWLQLAKTVEMIGYPGEPRLEIYNSLTGRDGQKAQPLRSFALEVLLDLPLRLGRLTHTIFGDSVDTFEFDTVYTLFEFIDGIAWELSFHGMPRHCQIRR